MLSTTTTNLTSGSKRKIMQRKINLNNKTLSTLNCSSLCSSISLPLSISSPSSSPPSSSLPLASISNWTLDCNVTQFSSQLSSCLLSLKSSTINRARSPNMCVNYQGATLPFPIVVLLTLLLALCLTFNPHVIQFSFAQSVCSISQFQCVQSLECIPLSHRCDSFIDCPDDRSDEVDCPQNCTEEEIACTNGNCIPADFWCDGQRDCADGSDEEECVITCAAYQFKCSDSKKCINKIAVCDGRADCLDASDEGAFACLFHVSYCAKHEFNCSNGHCVSGDTVCDGTDDCGDASDEANCTSTQVSPVITILPPTTTTMDTLINVDTPIRCEDQQFMCADRMECIEQSFVCDGQRDCEDASDESEDTCAIHQYEELRATNNDDANQSIVSLPPSEGNVSLVEPNCPSEYHFNPEHNRCEDIDECTADYSICSGQRCVNTVGGFQCHCHQGYQLLKGRYCLLQPSDHHKDGDTYQMLYMSSGSIRSLCWTNRFGEYPRVCIDEKSNNQTGDEYHRVDLDQSQPSKNIIFQSPPVSNTINSQTNILFDFNIAHNYYIVWFKSWQSAAGQFYLDRLRKDQKSASNGQIIMRTPRVLLQPARLTVTRIALDWVNHIVYYIAHHSNITRIEALKIAETQSPKNDTHRPTSTTTSFIIVHEHLDLPVALAVNPIESWIIWLDLGSVEGGKGSRFERCTQTGENRRTIFADTDDIVSPVSITIDYATRRIFWIDRVLHSISSIDYDGNDRRLVYQSFLHIQSPVDLHVFDSILFWIDYEANQTTSPSSSTIYTINKFGLLIIDENDTTTTSVHPFLTSKLGEYPLQSLAIVHQSRQPQPTDAQCKIEHCSYLCVATNVSYGCICPLGYFQYRAMCLTELQFRRTLSPAIEGVKSKNEFRWSLMCNKIMTKLSKAKNRIWLVTFVVVLSLLIVAFLAPYACKALMAYCNNNGRRSSWSTSKLCSSKQTDDRRSKYRWTKLSNLTRSGGEEVHKKSVQTCGTLLSTISNVTTSTTTHRRDDASSGYSSISEQLSLPLQDEVVQSETEDYQ